MARVDFSTVTELGGEKGSRAQLGRACSRYYFAAEHCAEKDVLEVACGVGQGLGYLARRARRVVGLDIEERNLEHARTVYRGRRGVTLVKGDAEALPFDAASFDVVLLYEAIYYLANPERFVAEARRALRPGGTLIICSANKDLPDFNPGAFTYRYFSPPELVSLLARDGFDTQIFGSAAVGRDLVTTAVRVAKAIGARLHLIPTTMRGKELLKRIVFGRLVPMPAEILDGMAPYDRPVPIAKDRPSSEHLVLFAVGKVPTGA